MKALEFNDLRVIGQRVLGSSIIGQDIQDAVLHWCYVEGILGQSNEGRHFIQRVSMVECLVGMIASKSPLLITSRSTKTIYDQIGSTNFLNFVDRLFEQGFLDKAPIKDAQVSLTNVGLLLENIKQPLDQLLDQ